MECSLFSRCREAFDSLNITKNLLDPRGDKCYCLNCYKDDPIYKRGGQTYEMPLRACRFGVKMRNTSNQSDSTVFKDWHNAYHGTKAESILPILKTGLKVPDGVNVKILPGHIPNEYFIFTSASFAYSTSKAYAKDHPFKDNVYKFYVQVKRPESYITQSETLSKKLKVQDKFLDKNVLEYKTKNEKDVIIIGVLVYEISPSSNPSLPPELVLNDVMSEFFKLKGDEIIGDSVKSLEQKHYNINTLIEENLDFLNSLNSLDSRIDALSSDIQEDKEVGNGFRIGTNVVAGVGGVLCFTPLAPLGLVLGIGGAAGGIGTAIGTGRKKSDLSKEVESIQRKYFRLQELQQIMEEFYNMIAAKTKAYLNDKKFVGILLTNLAKTNVEIGKLSEQALQSLAVLLAKNVSLVEQYLVGFSKCVSSIGLAKAIQLMPLISKVQQAEKVGKLLDLGLARNMIAQNTKAIAILEAKQAQLI